MCCVTGQTRRAMSCVANTKYSVLQTLRGSRRPASPTPSTASYKHDDFAVVEYDPTSCDNGVTSRSSDRRPTHRQHVQPLSQQLTWPPSDDKLPTPTSTVARCPRPVSSFQDGGQYPLDAASYHCQRCSAALQAISQSVCCSRRAPFPGDVTSGSDVASATSGGSRVRAETERAPDCKDVFQNTADNDQSQDRPPDYDQ